MKQDNDDDHFSAFSLSDLGPILTAAVFGLAFLACLVWVLITDDPWHDFIPKDKPAAAPAGEVTVTIPPPKGRP